MSARLKDGETMQAGLQPLDELMTKHEVTNHDLVLSAGGAFTHKAVQKGRSGRRLTGRTQRKLLEALRTRLADPALQLTDLFNYRGR